MGIFTFGIWWRHGMNYEVDPLFLGADGLMMSDKFGINSC